MPDHNRRRLYRQLDELFQDSLELSLLLDLGARVDDINALSAELRVVAKHLRRAATDAREQYTIARAWRAAEQHAGTH